MVRPVPASSERSTCSMLVDSMYEGLAQSYVLDPENREFVEQSNPWALRGIAERLLEAVDRQMWAELQQADLDTERDLGGGESPAQVGR